MKPLQLIAILTVAQILSACGGSYSKNPVTDLGSLRDSGKKELEVKDEPLFDWAISEAGLTDEVSEGTPVSFAVTVQVGGFLSKANQTPTLQVKYDGQGANKTGQMIELDGARHVVADPANPAPEFLGQGRWKFNLVFDTTNVAVEAPAQKTNEAQKNVIATQVRFNMKVKGVEGTTSDTIVKQIRIRLVKPIASPRFDLSGIRPEAIELLTGQTLKLPFVVISGDLNAEVKIEIPNLKTLPGSPEITCKSTPEAKNRKDCQLQWTVPCATNANELRQEISITAAATIEGKNSKRVTLTLKTSASKKQSTCQKLQPTTAKAAPTAKKPETKK